MVGNRGVSVGSRVEPDFVTPGGLAIELEAARFQLTNYFPIAESREPTYSGCDCDRVIPPLTCARKILRVVPFAPGLDQLPCNIACDVERLSDGPPLGDQARNFFRRREEDAFRKLLHMYLNGYFHFRTARRCSRVAGFVSSPAIAMFHKAAKPQPNADTIRVSKVRNSRRGWRRAMVCEAGCEVVVSVGNQP